MRFLAVSAKNFSLCRIIGSNNGSGITIGHECPPGGTIVYPGVQLYIYIYIWDSFRQNGPSYIYIKCYKNASLLNCYIFRTVNAINFQFSTLHTTPFPYGKIYFGVLHLLRASIATFDTPSGSNPP